MKKTILLTAALLTALTLFAGCQQAKSNEEVPVRTIEKKLTAGGNEVNFTVDFPEGKNTALNTIIAEYFSQNMGGDYNGDYANGDSLVTFYAEKALKELTDIHDGIEDEMTYTNELIIQKTYETDRIVTFEIQTDDFTGGAHGYGIYYGATFRKSDGQLINMNVLPNNIVENGYWKKLMKEGLKEYFEVKTDRELEECIDVDINDLPLPETEVHFNEKGLVMTYQSYEIACYAAGRPSFVIPYSKLEPYMNTTGKSLFYDK